MNNAVATPNITLATPTAWEQHILEKLDALLEHWHMQQQVPPETALLSSGQYTALFLAAGHEQALGHSPLQRFLLLENWLQRWILERRGMDRFAGTRIG